MKFMLLGIFVFFFVIIPMYLLNTLVMPDLQSLKDTYSQADTISHQMAGLPTGN